MTDFPATRRIEYAPVEVTAPKACSARAHTIAGVLMAYWTSPAYKGRLGQRDAVQRGMYMGRLNSADPTVDFKLTRELVDVSENVIGDWILSGSKRSNLELVAQGVQLGLDYPEPRPEIDDTPQAFRNPVGTVC